MWACCLAASPKAPTRSRSPTTTTSSPPGGADSTVRLWDITRPAHPAPLATLGGSVANVYSIAYGPSRPRPAAGSTDGTTWLWNLANPRQPADLATLTGAAKGVLAVAFSPDGH